MKYNRILPALALAVILSLLILAIPATPALAQTVQLTPSQGPAGTTVYVTGAVFIGNGTITVSYDGTQVATGSITPNGTFDVTFTATGAVGSHTITSTDGTSTPVTSTFTITTAAATTDTTPPPTPSPLLPLMGGTANSKAYFDWEDVTDTSTPVTYNLQIASDIAFTTIVLDKAGLTTSEYTLTEEEKLQPATAETLYYWRVRAIDGASNVSGWTGAGIFHVGSTFALTGPILYVVIGFGYLLVFFLCFWISRSGARQ